MRPTWTIPPWGLPPAQVFERLGSSPAGLDTAEAARRLIEDGPSAVAQKARALQQFVTHAATVQRAAH